MVMEKIALDIGVGLATGLAQDGTKLAARKMLTQDAKSKDPILYFGLWVNFREAKPSFDETRAALNDALHAISRNGTSLTQDSNTFDHDITWKTVEGCEYPIDQQWENDALLEQEQDFFSDLPPECVSGFALWLWPSSLSKRKGLIISAYRMLKLINGKLQEDRRVPKMKCSTFAFIRANSELCLKIHSRLSKRINGNDETKGLLGTIDIASVSSDTILLTVPLKELIVAEALADSFSPWGLLKNDYMELHRCTI